MNIKPPNMEVTQASFDQLSETLDEVLIKIVENYIYDCERFITYSV